MKIIGKNVLGVSRNIFWILILTFFFTPSIQTCSANGWPSSDEFEVLGYNVQIGFNPEPGTISSEITEIKGNISINGEFTGYDFAIIIDSYWTFYKNETIFSNEDIGQRIIILNSSFKNYTEEILLDTPISSGQFTVYMVVYFGWREEMSPDITGNKTITLMANYQKLGYDLANIIIPSVIFLFLISLILISVFGYKKVLKRKELDTNEISERLENINILNKQFFTRAGNFTEMDLSAKSFFKKPGQLTLLEHRKHELEGKLKKLAPRQVKLDKIAKRLEEARYPILSNDFFKFISSHFIQASRKRENYPHVNNVEEKVLELRNSLREGRWDELQDLEKVKLAWMICESYIRETNDKELLTNIDVNTEAKSLVKNIKSYIQTKANTKWPPDRNLILKTIEETKTELEINEGLINKLRKSDKKTKKKYLKKCENLKREAENNLKWLRWLKSRETDIDTDILSRNSLRLKELVNLLENEINLFN